MLHKVQAKFSSRPKTSAPKSGLPRQGARNSQCAAFWFHFDMVCKQIQCIIQVYCSTSICEFVFYKKLPR